MVFQKINRKLLPMKAHFLLFNAGTGPVVPFLPTLAKQLGFSTAVVGFIYTLLPIFGMIAKPTLGAIADRYHCQRSLFLLSILVACIGFFSLNFVPPIVIHSHVHLRCDAETVFSVKADSYGTVCEKDLFVQKVNSGNFTLACQMICASNNASGFASQICHQWGNTDFCNADPQNANEIAVITKPEKKDGEHSGKSSVNNGKRRESQYRLAREFHGQEYFQIKAEVDSFHIEFIKDELYFPIKKAYFHSERYFIPYCTENHTATCQISCNDKLVNELVSKVSAENQGLSDTEILKFYEFWLFLALIFVAWVSMAAVVSIGDAICFELLGDRPEDYGLQRAWGAIGWGALSILAGYLVDLKSEGQITKDYTPAFYLCALLLVIDLLVSSRIKLTQSKMSSNILKDVGKLLRDVRVVVFLFWCVIVGMCTALVWQFLFIFLEELATKLGCSSKNWMKSLQGFSMGVQCFGGELPFFFLSGWILRKLGHVHCMSLVLISFGVRFLLYSFLTDPWYSLPIELLNGFTLGGAYSTMASYASIIAPPGTETSVQGLVGAVFEGVGMSLGSLIGGLISHSYGGAAMFKVFGIGCCVVFVLHVMLQKLIETRYRRGSAIKDVATNAIYTSPTEAIHMLEKETGDSAS